MKKEVTTFTLKMIAILTMVLDHIGAVLLERVIWGITPKGAAFFYSCSPSMQSALKTADLLLRGIGRLSFPLFCFLLVEGFFYTSNRRKHALLLGIFALLSEIPFDLAVNRQIFEIRCHNNVMITLLLGFLGMWLLEFTKEKIKEMDLPASLSMVCNALVIGGLYLLADFIRCDYGGAGVLAILGLYVLREKSPYAGYILAVVILAVLSHPSELIALLGLLPLLAYHGKQGRKMKYFFYAFYPLHFLALAGLGVCLGI